MTSVMWEKETNTLADGDFYGAMSSCRFDAESEVRLERAFRQQVCKLLGWRPFLLGWRPSLLGWTAWLLGCLV